MCALKLSEPFLFCWHVWAQNQTIKIPQGATIIARKQASVVCRGQNKDKA